MPTPTLMIQGTTSDAGKSTLVAGLCRVLHRRGIRVVPFKPQNMALNSAVTVDCGEIGRAQAVQAYACGLAPHTDMNPVLLKPNTDVGAQVIIHGHPVGEMEACTYHDYKRIAMQAVLESYERLARQYDVILVEGAGSPAEINLRDKDIANMGFAEAVNCPVLLVADIDRGGVFAHLVGTLALLAETEQARTKGFVINRFRGDLSLLQSGLDWLENHTGKPVLGVIPYLHGLFLEAEDAIATEELRQTKSVERLKVIAPVYPRISNHTDFDALRLHPQIDLQLIGPNMAIPSADLIILPGSKSVRGDLDWLRAQGWEVAIARHLRYDGKVIGICGGMQMLGEMIHDPDGIEGLPGSSRGLGWLAYETRLMPQKQLRNVTGRLTIGDASVQGYEIHAGITQGRALENPVCWLDNRPDGTISADQQILATYVHGLFDSPSACAALLQWAGLKTAERVDVNAERERGIERLADAVEASMDIQAVLRLLR